MEPMNIFQGIGNQIRKRRELNNAIRRIRSAPDLCRILSRSQVVELIKLGAYARDLRQAQEAMRYAVDNFSMDLQEQVDYFTGLLRPDRRPPDASEEENRTRNAESELDRLLNVLPPRQKGPSFFVSGPPDPQSAADGIAMNGGTLPGPSVHTRTRTRGALTQVEYSTTDANGTTQVITETSRSGQLIGRVINVYDNRGRLIKEAREYLGPVDGDGSPDPTGTVARWEHIPGHRFHYFWRYADEEKWHEGVPPGNPRDWPGRGRPDPVKYPLDDPAGGVPHFFLKLRNGGYAMCYVTNPAAGLSYCTLMSRDHVNIQEGVAPMIEAGNLIVHPDDLVINPDPNNPLVQDLLTPEEVEHRFESPDPGPRDPVPDLT